MPWTANEGIDSDPLAAWYLEAEPLFSALSDSCDIVRTIRSSPAGSPTVALEDLSAIMLESEVWLLTHPAPDTLHWKHLESIVQVFVTLGDLFEAFSEDVSHADDGTLDEKIAQAVWMVDEVKQIRDALIMKALGRRGSLGSHGG